MRSSGCGTGRFRATNAITVPGVEQLNHFAHDWVGTFAIDEVEDERGQKCRAIHVNVAPDSADDL